MCSCYQKFWSLDAQYKLRRFMGNYLEWKLHEGCFVTCYLQESNFQFSGVDICSKPPGRFERKVQSNFNGHSRKLIKSREVSLGNYWEIGTLNKMKRPNWLSPRMLSENASSSLCSTVFMSIIFIAFEGRILIKSSATAVSQMNIEFAANSVKQR